MPPPTLAPLSPPPHTHLNLTSSATRLHVGSRSLMMTPQLLIHDDHVHQTPMTFFHLCFFFFFTTLGTSASTPSLSSYHVACLSPSIFCLLVLVLALTTTHLSHISSFSYPYPLLPNCCRCRRRRHPNSFRLHIPLLIISSSNARHYLDPMPLYDLNLVLQLPCCCPLLSVIQAHPRGEIRYD